MILHRSYSSGGCCSDNYYKYGQVASILRQILKIAADIRRICFYLWTFYLLTALLNIRPQSAADHLDHRAAVHHRVRRGEVSRQVGTRGDRATEKSSS